jgi:hypothetical protein
MHRGSTSNGWEKPQRAHPLSPGPSLAPAGLGGAGGSPRGGGSHRGVHSLWTEGAKKGGGEGISERGGLREASEEGEPTRAEERERGLLYYSSLVPCRTPPFSPHVTRPKTKMVD